MFNAKNMNRNTINVQFDKFQFHFTSNRNLIGRIMFTFKLPQNIHWKEINAIPTGTFGYNLNVIKTSIVKQINVETHKPVFCIKHWGFHERILG